MANRKALRDAIFSEENRKPNSTTIEVFGQVVEIRQPTLFQITSVGKASAANEKIPAFVRMLIEYLYVPGTDDKLFELADADSLASMPSGKWINDINEAFTKLTNVDVKEAEKNSEETD